MGLRTAASSRSASPASLLRNRGATVAPPDAFHECFDIGIDPNGAGALQYQRTRRVIHESAAAGGDYFRFTIDQPRYHAAFSVAEMCFTESLENLADRHPGGLFDLVIGIHKRQVQAMREPFAYTRFPDAHQPDKNYRLAKIGLGKGSRSGHCGGGLYTGQRFGAKGTRF